MKLEPIKNSDICEKEKTPILYKHTHTHIYIYGIYEDGDNDYTWGYKRDTDVKNGLLDSVEEGEGRMIWEDRTETCISAYVKLVKVQVWCMR